MDDFTKKRIERIMDKYTKNRIPQHLQDRIRMNYKIRGNNVTLIEERPAFKSDQWVQHDVAQFRQNQNQWKVYWKDSKGKWHYVEEIEPNEEFERQLKIVDEDNRGIFWG
ncbi:hypothetical protein AWM70_12280 [Paenibacillus yonginensis]|uniref:DUF3024 domain-containing protein n=1 Tax=Paenibacillus yonginensis TaxID=1462996 RepID=A0A1B1N1K1_9BACL|nr:DUF3024 domain-containing protein [Paenibacillus yonginensis]ANS75286.1 hypothetical protein AWM70_12280 [Paenibacillus yonginensis]